MQPYVNPNYFNQNPYQNNYGQPIPAPNPYMDRIAQLQQYQQNIQPLQQNIGQQGGLIGKIVNDFSEITANDVPMNGISAVFPKADMSEVQLRTWTPSGTIQVLSYKPILDQNNEKGTNIPQMDFNGLNEDVRALRDDIKEMRSMIEKSMTKQMANRGKKAEANIDE